MENRLYITIQRGEEVFIPVVKEGVKLTRELGGIPSTLTFSALIDDILKIENGDRIKLIYEGATVFVGYVFELKKSSDEFIQVTAYDQLRYFKNKRSYYMLRDKTATEIIQMIADDYGMKYENMTDTKHKVGLYISDNQSLIDLIYWYIYTTKIETGILYELYDDGGMLTLSNIDDMKTEYLLEEDTLQNFSFSKSIDKATYNVVTLVQSAKDSEDGKRKLFIKADQESIKKWGRLELTGTVDGDENGDEKASNLLKTHDKETRYFTAKGAIGDIMVRGGSLIVSDIKLEDGEDVKKFMVVRKVVHTFENGAHLMDLTLIGGDLNI